MGKKRQRKILARKMREHDRQNLPDKQDMAAWAREVYDGFGVHRERLLRRDLGVGKKGP